MHSCLCVCVCKLGRWPSLAEPLSEDVSEYRGPLLMEGLSLCFPHLRVHTDLHRHPLHSVCWQDIQSHHTGTLFLSNTRVSGLFTPQIRVQAKRKNRRRSEGCVDGGNGIRIMDAWLNKTSGFVGRNIIPGEGANWPI